MKLWIRFLFFFLILFWIAGIFIEFIIPHLKFLAFIYPFAERVYSTVCHQQPEKLITFGGHSTLVCARCAGIYIGGFISSFYFIFQSKINIKNGKLMLLASLPMLADVLFYKIGFYEYSKIIAFISGAIFGSIGIAYIYNGFQILLRKND